MMVEKQISNDLAYGTCTTAPTTRPKTLKRSPTRKQLVHRPSIEHQTCCHEEADQTPDTVPLHSPKALQRKATQKRLFDVDEVTQHPMKNNAFKKHVKFDHWAPVTLHKLPVDNTHVLVTDSETGEVHACKSFLHCSAGEPPSKSTYDNDKQDTFVVVKQSSGERIVIKAQARPISLERERVLGYDSVDSLEQRGFMIIRSNLAIRKLAESIAENPKCKKLDEELHSTKFFTEYKETSDLLKTMADVLDDYLGASCVELAEETTARVRVGPSATFPSLHKDLQSSWRPKGRGDYNSTSHGASANVFNAWMPLADVTEKDCPLGLVPISNTFAEISSPRSARKLFRYRQDLQVFDAETFTLGKHKADKLNTLEYFPIMTPGDLLLFKSDAVFHAALSHLNCRNERNCTCMKNCNRKSLDVRLFIS
jgi:hypothetical protein